MREFDLRTTSSVEAATLATLATLRQEVGSSTEPHPRFAALLDQVISPLPRKIQVQTFTRCNAACAMCPYPDVAGASDFPHTRMEETLFRSLLEQLEGQPVERFSPFLMNEPLLDKRLESWLHLTRRSLPTTTLGLFTNGSPLTARRAQGLADAGLDELCVSVHGFDKATYESVMVGLSYDGVMSQLREVVTLFERGALGPLRLQIVTGDVPTLTNGAAMAPEWLAPHVLLKGFSNERAVSEVESTAGLPCASVSAAPRPLCQRPFMKLYVLADGDCVMCNCDWRRRVILGNLNKNSLQEIWRGDAYRALRLRHLQMSFEPGHPCYGCDYPWVVEA